MRAARPLLAVCAALALAGAVPAQPKPQEALVGRWGPADPKAKGVPTLEFFKDGKLKVVFDELTVDGTWKFTDNDTVVLTLTLAGGETKTETARVKVNDKEVEFTPSVGKTEKFARLK